MKARMRAVGFAMAVAGALAQGADAVYTTEVKDPKLGKAQPVSLWVPDGVEVLRGGICQMRYEGLVHRADYRKVARAWRFALVGGMLEHGGDLRASLLAALKDLAAQSGHPEVEHFPLTMSGFSNGAWMAVNLTKVMPERVIAVVPCAMPGVSHDLGNPAPAAIFRSVPLLQVNGANDGATHRWFETWHPRVRQARYLWGLANQWGLKHHYGNTNALGLPFQQEAIEARLPKDADARKGPVALRPVRETDGWLGDTDTWRTNWATIRPFSDDEAKRPANTWLLNEHVAHLWRAFVAFSPKVRVSVTPDPAAQGAVALRATGAFPDGLAAVQFFDGKVLLGEAKAPPYAIRTAAVASGVHSVFAVCVTREGQRTATRPVLCIDAGTIDHDREERKAKEGKR